jgi:hypothetical protein
MNLDRLREFLVEANRAGYASDQTTFSNDPDGSHTIVFESDGWRFEDNFFGGEPQQSSHVSPCQASCPSLAARTAMPKAASGSAHHHPTVALRTRPARSIADR